MTKILLTDAFDSRCPIRNVLSRISDKWSMLVLCTIHASHTPIRFKELQRAIPDISQKMLTATLKTLEEDGLVTRKAYPEIPPRVEYALTDRSRSLLPHINGLIDWATDNMSAIMSDRREHVQMKS